METVIPAVGRRVRIVNGAYRDATGVLLGLNEKRFSCSVQLDQVSQDKQFTEKAVGFWPALDSVMIQRISMRVFCNNRLPHRDRSHCFSSLLELLCGFFRGNRLSIEIGVIASLL